MSRSRWSLLSAKSRRFVLQKKNLEGKNGRGRLLFSVRCPFNEKQCSRRSDGGVKSPLLYFLTVLSAHISFRRPTI